VVIGGLLFVIKPMMSDSGDEAGLRRTTPKVVVRTRETAAETEEKRRTRRSDSMVYAIKDIVVNPAGTGGTRFLSVSFGFELGDAGLMAEFTEREALVRDALITILSSKTVAQLTDAKRKK
jgi:flagellar basal body-associated protein FliL